MRRGSTLTDVVVLVSHVELVAQREGAVALELLREFDRGVRGVGSVALPALEAQLRVACAVATVTDHVEHILLGHAPLAAVVVWTEDVQVIVHVHLQGVALPPQTARKEKKKIQRNLVYININRH